MYTQSRDQLCSEKAYNTGGSSKVPEKLSGKGDLMPTKKNAKAELSKRE